MLQKESGGGLVSGGQGEKRLQGRQPRSSAARKKVTASGRGGSKGIRPRDAEQEMGTLGREVGVDVSSAWTGEKGVAKCGAPSAENWGEKRIHISKA